MEKQLFAERKNCMSAGNGISLFAYGKEQIPAVGGINYGSSTLFGAVVRGESARVSGDTYQIKFDFQE